VGVIYRLSGGDAFVTTNYHVVYSANSIAEDGIGQKIELYLFGATDPEAAIPASYVGGSMHYDLAVLRVQDSEVLRQSCAMAATLGDSDALTAGQRAIAVGNPEGGGLSVTSGIVSVASEYLTMTAADEVTQVNYRTIRVDTPINSGNSGGGLYNAEGELIGVVNAKLVSTSVENIGFAIPSAIVKGVTENILYHCYEKESRSVMRALIGVQLVEENTRMVVDEESGALLLRADVRVDSVSEDGAAHGLVEAGDVLLAVTVGEVRTEVTRSHHVIDAMLYAREGDTVVLEIDRAGQRRTVQMEITPECMRAY
jgi:serine protease Do